MHYDNGGGGTLRMRWDSVEEKERFESTFVDVKCTECKETVNVSQKYLMDKVEKGIPIRCKDCRGSILT